MRTLTLQQLALIPIMAMLVGAAGKSIEQPTTVPTDLSSGGMQASDRRDLTGEPRSSGETGPPIQPPAGRPEGRIGKTWEWDGAQAEQTID
jgi:hypothetical protein